MLLSQHVGTTFNGAGHSALLRCPFVGESRGGGVLKLNIVPPVGVFGNCRGETINERDNNNGIVILGIAIINIV